MRLGLVLLTMLTAVTPAAAQPELRGHGGPVRAIAVAQDGKLALTGSFDQSAILWSLERGVALAVLRAHEGAVNAVAALPDGLDTRIGERGMSLSGGQRQRLALARALVRSPRLLVMDDATSSVDPRIEAAILAGLRSSSGGVPPTVVVVAYRKATIALADDVVYVEHGRVVDRGSHLELLGRCEGYRSLITAYEREDAERLALVADEDSSVA